jgi:CRP-like cAMP-binding protein
VLAHPPQALVATSVPAPATAQAAAPSTAAQRLLDAVPLFASLADAERSTLADAMTRKTYRKGEVLVEQGRSIGPLMVIRSGVIVVTRHSEEGELELRRLAPGDCFGGGALTGGSESGTVRALTSCVVYAIGLEALAGLLHEKPGLAEDLRAVLTRPNDSHVVNLDENTRTPAVIALMSRLRKLLNGSQSPADGAAARSAVTVLPP